MSVELDLQHGFDAAQRPQWSIPAEELFCRWVARVAEPRRDETQLTVRLVDNEEMATLNERYRGKQGVTNVLSFPYQPTPGVALPLLGDIVICVPLVIEEAEHQGKDVTAHWAHLVIHGMLHLLGYDHQGDRDAGEMETLETELLNSLGYDDPYRDGAA